MELLGLQGICIPNAEIVKHIFFLRSLTLGGKAHIFNSFSFLSKGKIFTLILYLNCHIQWTVRWISLAEQTPLNSSSGDKLSMTYKS